MYVITIMPESQPPRLKHFRRGQDINSERIGMLGTLCTALRSTSIRYYLAPLSAIISSQRISTRQLRYIYAIAKFKYLNDRLPPLPS
jgi:hypothetical protein